MKIHVINLRDLNSLVYKRKEKVHLRPGRKLDRKKKLFWVYQQHLEIYELGNVLIQELGNKQWNEEG